MSFPVAGTRASGARAAPLLVTVIVALRRPRRVHGAHLADHRDLDPPRIVHLALDLLREIAGQQDRLRVIHLLVMADHADLATRLDRIRLLDPLERVGEALELLDPLDVVGEAGAPRTGP